MNEEITFKDRVLSTLAYIWPFGIFLLPFKNKNEFRKRHIFDGLLLTLFITFIAAIKIIIEEMIFTKYESNYTKYLSNISKLNKGMLIAFAITILFQIFCIIRVWIKPKEKQIKK